MNFEKTSIPGVWVISTSAHKDERGEFSRLYCYRELEDIIGQKKIVQINHSKTHKVGAIRGLHFQKPPSAEIKIVRCIKGRVFDVAVDLRRDSDTFLKWTSVELTPESHTSFLIPEGCAHGFQVLDEDSELLYLHTAFYSPDDESGVRYDEPMIGVGWPQSPTEISERDLNHQYLTTNFKGINL